MMNLFVKLRPPAQSLIGREFGNKCVLCSHYNVFAFARLSFHFTTRGTINHLIYEKGEDKHVLNVKRSLLGMLSSSVVISDKHMRNNTGWAYRIQETGYEGERFSWFKHVHIFTWYTHTWPHIHVHTYAVFEINPKKLLDRRSSKFEKLLDLLKSCWTKIRLNA